MLIKKNKLGNGNIIMAVFLIILILLIIFLFTRYNELILFSNYSVNEKKFQLNYLYSLKDSLVDCYSYPILYDSSLTCNSLDNLNFRFRIISNGICDEKILIQNGFVSDNYLNIFLPVFSEDKFSVCMGILDVYFIEK